MKRQQKTPLELAICDKRPFREWAAGVKRLVPNVYEHDEALARKLEAVIGYLARIAADLDCIGTDDPTAPEFGDPADRVVEYLFRRSPEKAHELGHALARADQILGRRQFLGIIGI